MSHSTLTGLFLHCPVLFSVLLFFTHQTEQPLMSALCYWFHNLSRHAPTGVYSLGVITSWLVCCPARVPRTMNLNFALRGEVYRKYLSTVCFLFNFPVFWLPAQRSVMVPQLSLSTVPA